MPSSDVGGTYEMWQLGMTDITSSCKESLISSSKSLESDQTQLCGLFTSVFGPMGSAVLIWRHNSLDKAPELQDKLFTSENGNIN